MTDRTIATRPSLEQVTAIVDFMEKHPALALGQLRGLDGRHESKKLWLELTRLVNNITGPTRPLKSWVKFWADKKSNVRAKVQGGGGDPNNLCSNVEKKIWDLFLADDHPKIKGGVKLETQFIGEPFLDEDSMDQNHVTTEPSLAYEVPIQNFEDRQLAVMEKLVKVMNDQAAAMSQLAHASMVNTQAMERLAESSIIQARAVDRLASTFESISASTHDVRNAIVDIDTTMKRYYNTSPT